LGQDKRTVDIYPSPPCGPDNNICLVHSIIKAVG
jgi:hypothetical protein